MSYGLKYEYSDEVSSFELQWRKINVRCYGDLTSEPVVSEVIPIESTYQNITEDKLYRWDGSAWVETFLLSPTSAAGALTGQPMGLLMGITYS
jgi:hypothetical protein